MTYLKFILVTSIMISASITDIRKREFPIAYQLILLALAPLEFRAEYFLGTLIAVPFFVACLISDGMGGGDWKAVGILGLLSGLGTVLIAVISGCTGFIVYGFIAEKIKGEGHKTFPFIPFLTAGYILAKILEVALN